jgi:ectoine hydroxylase-related dioxygenase (phytanoyl-CoA dioxygenase family)
VTAEATIAADDLARFEAQGYLVLRGLTTEKEVVGLQSIYDRLFDPATTIVEEDRVELAGGAAGMLPQILNPDRYAPELRESPAFRNAEQAARSLLGPKAELMGLHAIRKPPRSGAPTPWHQDEAYWDPSYRHRAVSIWIPLQKATAANGCLSFLPGSHRDGLRDHELTAPGCADGLQAVNQHVIDGVTCELNAGDATVHDGRTLHSAGPNSTDGPRRALVIAFRTPPIWIQQRTLPWQPSDWSDVGA